MWMKSTPSRFSAPSSNRKVGRRSIMLAGVVGVTLLGVVSGPARPAAAQFLPPGIVNPYANIDIGEDRYPSHVIAPDGTIHVVWATQNPYTAQTGTDPDIYYSRNDGTGWTFPEYVNPWAETDTAIDDLPRLSLGPDGVVHVVWQSQHDGGTWGTDWDVFYRALDPSSGWGPAVAINADAETDDIAIDADDTVPNLMARLDGSVLVIYQSEYGYNGYQLHWRVVSESGWSTDLTFGYDALGPGSLTLTADGDVILAWEEIKSPSMNHVIATSKFTSTGGWSGNGALTQDTANHIQPAVTTIGKGLNLEVHYVWATNDSAGGLGTDYDLKHFVDLSQYPWEYGPFTVNSTATTDGSADDLRPSICVEPGNVLHVVWQSAFDAFTGTDLDVYHADNGSPGGEWSSIGLLGLNAPFDGVGEDDTYPEIRCSSAHVLSGMWMSEDDLGGAVGNDNDIFHALGLGRVYHRPRPAAPWAIFDTDTDSRVDIAQRGGVVHMVWESANSGGFLSTGPDFDIYHVAYSNGVFQSQQLVNTSGNIDGGDDHDPAIAIDHLGHLHVVWSSETDIGGTVDTDADIFYTMYDGSTWSAPELVNASGTSDSIDDLEPTVALDAAGVVHVAWYERLSSISGQLAYSERVAGVWSAKEIPTVPNATDWNPGSFDLAVEPGGVAHLVWNSWADHDGAGSDTDIFWSRRVAGMWSTAELVNDYGTADSSPDDTPRLAVAPDGEVYAAWAGTYDGGGGGTDYDIFIAKRSADTLKATSSWQGSSLLINHFGVDSGTDMAPSIAVGAETIDVAWESDAVLFLGLAGTDTDIFHVRVPRTSALPADIGPGVVNPNAFGDSGADTGVSLAVVPGGDVFFAWESTDDLGIDVGTDLDILFGRLGESEVIFADGFESRNTAVWSNATP